MRIALAIYLGVYFVVVILAAITLWRSGIIEHLERGWTLAAIIAALAIGLLLGFVSRGGSTIADRQSR